MNYETADQGGADGAMMVRERAAQSGALIRFDWAVKRLLRHKADFVVVNGFLTSLLGHEVRIISTLESESNAQHASDRINRVDMLVEDNEKRKYIIEVQITTEVDYFHRMLYSASKVVTEYIRKGDKYGDIVKVFSINIVYFSLGQGSDYAYHGVTEFRGMNQEDVLQLSQTQCARFGIGIISDIFPEYYILRINQFDDVARTPLSEWIYFLKHGKIPQEFSAPGLDEARTRLAYDDLPSAERDAYNTFIEELDYEEGVLDHYKTEGLFEGHAKGHAEGRAEGLAEGLAEGHAKGHAKALQQTAAALKKAGVALDTIIQATGLSAEEIAAI
jgi:hypothetical protein